MFLQKPPLSDQYVGKKFKILSCNVHNSNERKFCFDCISSCGAKLSEPLTLLANTVVRYKYQTKNGTECACENDELAEIVDAMEASIAKMRAYAPDC